MGEATVPRHWIEADTAMLIQLIGPQDCGKTALRRALCPGAICIDDALRSMWNMEMMGASGYYFEEWDPKYKKKLEDWMSGSTILVCRQGYSPMRCANPGIWIYEGHRVINVVPTRIWEIRKVVI